MRTTSAFGLGLFAVVFVLIALRVLLGCYGPNAVPVDPNYPPEPPFTETAADGGCG